MVPVNSLLGRLCLFERDGGYFELLTTPKSLQNFFVLYYAFIVLRIFVQVANSTPQDLQFFSEYTAVRNFRK